MAGPVERVIEQRLDSATQVDGPNPALMKVIGPFWALASDYYFRAEFEGWDRLPEGPCLFVSVHAGAVQCDRHDVGLGFGGLDVFS